MHSKAYYANNGCHFIFGNCYYSSYILRVFAFENAPNNASNTKLPQPQQPQHLWQKPGCVEALVETGVGLAGTALTTGAIAAAFILGPEELVGFEGLMTVLHVAPVGVPGLILTVHGGIGIAQKCF